MTEQNAAAFGSAMLTSIEGAFVVSKAQGNSTAHINASRAMTALAQALRLN
ncbi:MAG: hypothetical protein HC855_13340 [Rhizobiales bacterium]|nr:hypothetical protein [Hyphomicrobiales bacterium]